jgi:predicted ArsR family transcriptional regulator
MKARKVVSLDDDILDEIHDGPCTLTDLAYEFRATAREVRAAVERLMAQGYVEIAGTVADGVSGLRNTALYRMAKTRRAA